MLAYIGSRTSRERNARGEGISVVTCNAQTGDLLRIQVLGDLVNPSYLVLNSAATRLYAVHGDESYVSAYTCDPKTGDITALNQMDCEGKNPVHLVLDTDESHLVVANHITGSLAVMPIDEQGKLLPVRQLVKMEGECGPHRKEQPFAKPHFCQFDPNGQFLMVPDKGLDRLFSFRYSQGQLTPAAAPSIASREGAGPRHMAFHPTQPWVYVANELDSTLTMYRFDTATSALKPQQVLSCLSDRFTGNSRAAAIRVHPSGRFVYASNRGEDTIAVFAIDMQTGLLQLVQTQPCLGATPRFFDFHPAGHWLYVLNEESHSIASFAVDPTLGKLSGGRRVMDCGSPVCMVFAS